MDTTWKITEADRDEKGFVKVNMGLIGPDLAPTPRPAPASMPVAAPAPCTRENAAYIITCQVQAGTLPIGEVTGFSCTSAAEAEANAAAHEAEVRSNYAKTSEAGR
jgi:hypothetical protein